MTADLSPDVRDRAIAAAGAILCDWVGLADAQKWAAPPVVDAVTAVVAEEIERPLQARITELEAALRGVTSTLAPYDAIPEAHRRARAVLAKGGSDA